MKTGSNICLGITTSLIVLSGQSAFAFTIIPSDLTSLGRDYRPKQEYTRNLRDGFTELQPLSELPRGGTAEFKALLQDFINVGWEFTTASNDLEGSFQITRYQAIGTKLPVGANFQLDYIPQGRDPRPSQTKGLDGLHWIQRVVNNHSVVTEQHGDNDDAIDVKKSSRSKPFSDPGRLFYDFDVNFSDPPHFGDSPKRDDTDQSHEWKAELYLARFERDTGVINPLNASAPKGLVTIYNGVSWGWKNKLGLAKQVPEPLTILGSFIAIGFGVLCERELSQKKDSKQDS